MLAAGIVLSLLAVTGANANCMCYSDSIVMKSKILLSNAFDTSNFSPCYDSSCEFLADSNSNGNSVGWTNFTVTFSSKNDPTGVFTIYDGNTGNSNVPVIATYKVSQSGETIQIPSSTSSVYVKYTQDDTTKPNEYSGVMYADSGLAVPTTTTTTTPAPSTTPYTSSSFARNPQLISHDLLILVNQKTDQGLDGLNALNSLASQFVDLLSVTNSISSRSQSRLGLATLTPYSPNYAAQGEIWSMNATDVKNALPKSGVTSTVPIVNALTAVVPAFFDVADSVAPTRQNVQRSIVLFTAWWGDEELSTDLKKKFADYGVNLAIVGFNTVSTKLIVNDWYNYVNLNNNTSDDVASFVNRFYLNSDFQNSLTNNWCKKSADPTSDNNFIQEPSDYNGPDGSSANSAWSSDKGQQGRYCNFQDNTYTYQVPASPTDVTVTVFYELEIEKDYLKFYADNVEIESFTGRDVNNANFVVRNATTITVKFTTDNAGVQRGFYVNFA